MSTGRIGLVAALGVAAMAAACSSHGGGGGGANGPTVSDASAISVGRGVRRLSRREYNNVVRDLLGDTTSPANSFGIEVYVNGFDNGSDGLTVQGTDVLAFEAAAESLAATAVATKMPTLIGSCDPKQDEAACLEAFLGTFPKRAYRRPPSDTELQRLRAVYTAGAAAGGFPGGIQLVLEAILQSPAFLYREELGAPDPSLPANVVRLTDYEIASELSFLLTGSIPDDTLITAVENGSLKTPQDLQNQANRLLSSPAARPAFRAFLHEWMATDQVASANKDAMIYPSFNQKLAASMASELDDYFDSVLWSGSGSIRELFTSTQSSIDSALATTVYKVPAPGQGFQSVALDAQTRQGILTRAGFLTAHADTDSSGPIPRGVFVLNALLCEPPHPPPPNIPPAPPPAPAGQHQTTRQRFDMHVSNPFCQTCHSIIDGVGFGFEQFDGMGIFRTTENGSMVDTSGTLTGTDVDGPFVGASQLGQKLAKSQNVIACFAKQLYRYAMGQQEDAQADAVLGHMTTGFTADSPMTDAVKSLMNDPAFVLRTTAQTGQ
jgi:hypothetical protein